MTTMQFLSKIIKFQTKCLFDDNKFDKTKTNDEIFTPIVHYVYPKSKFRNYEKYRDIASQKFEILIKLEYLKENDDFEYYEEAFEITKLGAEKLHSNERKWINVLIFVSGSIITTFVTALFNFFFN